MALSDYEEPLKSFIHDEDKLVTYKWLSKELEVHVNVAKDILKEYWEKNKNEEDIVATFLLIGQLQDRSIRVEVVKESNLNTAKKKFVKIDCEHLYSLQKCLQDIELLTFAEDGDLRFSAIKCNEDYIRNDEEVESLRYVGNIRKEEIKSIGSTKPINKVPEKQEPKPKESLSKEKSKTTVNNKNDSKSKQKIEEKEKVVDSKLEDKPEVLDKKVSPTTKKEVSEKKVSPTAKSNNKTNNKVTKKRVQSKQAGFNHLFGKVANKPPVSKKLKGDADENQTNSSDNSQKTEEVKSTVEKDLRISNNKEDKKKDEAKENKKSKDSQEKENRNKQSEEKSETVSKTDNKTDNKAKSKNKKDARGTKRNRSQENNSFSKRKRIIVIESSEDESNNSTDEQDEPMEVEEEKPKIVKKRSPSPPAEKRENGKRMVRKTIDKTFKDEEGYLVTKRVHVYEVASDSEEPVEVKKEEPPKPQKITEGKTKKKQATLMSFFKKS